jgi:DNA invertase Pin-like site-specific DNA recombinase
VEVDMPSDHQRSAPRAIVYARYSSDHQRDASIEDQVRECRAYIERQGWVYEHAYVDRGLSGASTVRPGYQLMLEGAREGRFDIAVAEALDRFSRDQEDIAALYKRLRFAGISLVTLADGEISDLHVGLKGTMNALYLKDLADKTRRGLRGRVEAGSSGGGISYGYDTVRKVGPDGMPLRGLRRINPGEAEVVHRIFEAYAAGRSARRIAHDLNAERIPAPGGRAWGASTISGNAARGTGILNNELYVGRTVWNKLGYIKDPDTGRRVSRLNDPAQWVIKEVPELRIIEQELWDRVKARQEAMRCDTRPDVRARPCDRRRPRYLLSGLVVCGSCGGSYTKISANLFGCAAARNKGAAVCANLRNVRRDRLEEAVLDALRDNLMNPELFKEFCAEYVREINRMRGDENARRDRLRSELSQVERRLRRIVEAIADGVPARTLKEELLALEARQEQLEAQLAATPEAQQPLLHPNLAESYRQKVAALADALADDAFRDEAFEVIRSLLDKIVLVPEGEELRIEIHGELAGILELCQQGKTPGRSRASAEQIKVVAGAHNHRQFQISTPV